VATEKLRRVLKTMRALVALLAALLAPCGVTAPLVEGTLLVEVVTLESHREADRIYLRTDAGAVYKLEGAVDAHHLRSGARAVARGSLDDRGVLAVEHLYHAPMALAPHVPAVVRVLHVVVMLPTSTEAWASGVEQSGREAVRDIERVSLGRVHTSVYTRHYHLPEAPEGCPYAEITEAALAALNATDFPLVGLVATSLPWSLGGDEGCTVDGSEFAGVAQLFGALSWTRARDEGVRPRHRSVMFHELGHNFGLMHSNAPGDEYGDPTCSMGLALDFRGGNTLNGAALVALQWAGHGNGTAGEWDLGCLGTTNSVARLPTGLVVSHRCAEGHDAALPLKWQRRFYVHRMEADGSATILHWGNRPYRDPVAGVEISLVRYADGVATLASREYTAIGDSYAYIAAACIALLGGTAVAAATVRRHRAVRAARALRAAQCPAPPCTVLRPTAPPLP
jgi:hypothetical protein